MPRVIKSPFIKVDDDNIVTIDINNYNKSHSDLSGETEPSNQSQESNVEQEEELTIIEKARYEANLIIEQAKQDANIIKLRAKLETNEKKEKIYKETEESAYKEGYNKGLSDTNRLKQEAQKVLEDAYKERELIIDSTEPDIVNLIHSILDKLFEDAVKINPQIIYLLVKQGLEGTSVYGDVKIRVSSEDYDETIESTDKIASLLSSSLNIEIVKDASLSKADCIIETPFGNIDSSLSQQYLALKKDLYYIFENR